MGDERTCWACGQLGHYTLNASRACVVALNAALAAATRRAEQLEQAKDELFRTSGDTTNWLTDQRNALAEALHRILSNNGLNSDNAAVARAALATVPADDPKERSDG